MLMTMIKKTTKYITLYRIKKKPPRRRVLPVVLSSYGVSSFRSIISFFYLVLKTLKYYQHAHNFFV